MFRESIPDIGLKERWLRAAEVAGNISLVSSLKEKSFKKWAGVVLGSVAMGTAMAGFSKSKEDTSPTAVELSEDQLESLRVSIQERVGFDLMELARENGFNIQLDIDNGIGEYVVHVGQVHYIIDMFENFPEVVSGVIDCQKNIESLLLSLKSGEYVEPKIFSEMILAEDDHKAIIAYHTDNAERVVFGPSCLKDLLEAYEIAVKDIPESIHKFTLKYIFYKKLQSLYQDYKQSGDQNNALEKEFELAEEVLKVHPSLQEEGFYLAGVGGRLAVEGHFTVLGTEDLEINRRMMAAYRHLKSVQEEYKSIMEVDKKDPRLVDLGLSLDSAIVDFDLLVHGEREGFAVRQLTSLYNVSDSANINLMVYGHAHDFKNKILESNNKNPDKKLGLIKLTPVKDYID
jgi:hypothetical protein